MRSYLKNTDIRYSHKMTYECLFLTTGEPMKTLTNFRIDEDTRRDFHIWCIRNGTTIAEHLRTHINETLENEVRTRMPESVVKKNTGLNWLRGNKDETGKWEDTY